MVVGGDDSPIKGVGDYFFTIKDRLEIPPGESIHLFASHSDISSKFFAIILKGSNDLILITNNENGAADETENWSLKNITWFEDESKSITALCFDDEITLYIGTTDGSIYELPVSNIFCNERVDINQIFFNSDMKILSMQIYLRESSSKLVICSVSNSRLVIIDPICQPALVTFSSHINGIEIFSNNSGLNCVLVSLENGHNVYAILDDIESPVVNLEGSENHGKKSIFKKAKENFIAKFSSDDKINFFRKGNKENGSSTNSNRPNHVISINCINNQSQNQKPSFLLSSIKFQGIEEINCKGTLTKIKGKSSFVRFYPNKMDIFDEEFRQNQAIFIPTYINRIFPVSRIYYGTDEENKVLRCSLIYNGMIKEYAVISFKHKILSIESTGAQIESTPYNVFIISEIGIHELCLKKPPIETCVELLFKESTNSLFDIICTALNIQKTEACIKAGEIKSDEGRYAKSILYYKLAGLSHAKIIAKLGSGGNIAALLFFNDFIDLERTKLGGNLLEKQIIADIVLLARVERYLRFGIETIEQPKSPKFILSGMLKSNIFYSSKNAAKVLSEPQLIWALGILAEARLCYPEIIIYLYSKKERISDFFHYNEFWRILTTDWLALFTIPANVFLWCKNLIVENINFINNKLLVNVIKTTFIPWKREIQKKLYLPNTDISEIIDFMANTAELGQKEFENYIELYFILLLEYIKRNEEQKFETNKLPNFVYNNDPTELKRKYSKDDSCQITPLNTKKSFSVSSNFCAAIRNGRVYCWGENKNGRIGIDDDLKFIVDSPTLINLPIKLRISIEAISCGQIHVMALTEYGTIMVWGSNLHGQLGLGHKVKFSNRPVFLDLPDVIFISIAAGGYHSLALDNKGRVWSFGWAIYGQLGNGSIELGFYPKKLNLKDKIIQISAGHSHSVLINSLGQVYTFGCGHFGQLGQGQPLSKIKTPKPLKLPNGVAIKCAECGACGTLLLSTKNRLYYFGLNPNTMRCFLSSKKKGNERPEERDISTPILIDTSHLAGDIIKISVASTHFVICTSLGLVYSWGLGKSGQLARPEDDSKTLGLIECEDKMLVASNIACAGDTTFIIEKDTDRLLGSGFNCSGQLGKMEAGSEESVITIRTKKRLVKVRQPTNIYYRLHEIFGLPKEIPKLRSSIVELPTISYPPTNLINQQLLEWALYTLKTCYDRKSLTEISLKYKNYAAASILETMSEKYENALKHTLLSTIGDTEKSEKAITNYLENDANKSPSVEQACRFLRLLIEHWSKWSMHGQILEEILEKHRNIPPWDLYINCALKEIISSSDSSAVWISSNMSPLFILNAIKEGSNVTQRVSLELLRKSENSSSESYASSGADCDDYTLSPPRSSENLKPNGNLMCPIIRFGEEDNDIDITH